MNTFEIQAWLRNFGADIIVDGFIGPKTIAALRDALANLTKYELTDQQLPAAFEQLIYKIIGGLATGPVDGILGPVTLKARQYWLRGPWRNSILQYMPGDERMPDTLQRWPAYSELRSVFGEPGTSIVTISLPFPLKLAWDTKTTVHRTRCHALVADSLVNVQRQILKDYGITAIEKLGLNLYGGCFDMRPMRGANRLSTHAYGIAWDTDPMNNALAWGKDRARLARPIYDAYWRAWTNEGWTSLGKARDFDWMHTQACRLEGERK